MVNVFLSYDRDDAGKAKAIATTLEKAGHAVWWDQHINSGSQYSKAIERALDSADAVVVLWSAHAVESPWVRDEAASGRDRGILVPVTLDRTQPPLGFRQFQCTDLSDWKGRGSPPQLRALVADITKSGEQRTGSSAAVNDTPQTPLKASRSLRLRTALAIGLALVLAMVAAVWWFKTPITDAPTVSVLAADPSPASRKLAGSVRVALGSLHGGGSMKMRLLDTEDGAGSDLQVKVGSTSADHRIADVTLTSGVDQTILWSKHFDQSAGPTDMKQVVAASIGSILACATEEAQSAGLSMEVRQLYLRACAADDEGVDAETLIPQLRKITVDAPKFAPAWARLLNVEAIQIRRAAPWSEAATERARLKTDTASAKRADPELPELKLAELVLNNSPLQQTIEALHEAVSDHAENPNLLRARSEALAKVGAMTAATDDARTAAKFNRFSPILVAAYIRALIFEGKTAEARKELRSAQLRWPAVPALQYEAARLELRYGDFVRALPDTGARMDGGIMAYIKARSQPTKANKDAFLELARTHNLITSQKLFLIEALPNLDRVDDLYALMTSWPADRSLTESTELLFSPWTAPLRRDPRFMEYARRVKLIDYWRSTGNWPDFCSEPDMPYDCRAAAGKLAQT